jgi:hypothetical protein
MKKNFTNGKRLAPALAGLLSLLSALSASATLYTFNYTDNGPVPNGTSSTAFSAEHDVSVADNFITSMELILTFNDNTSLTGDGSGIQGHLVLGGSTSSPYVNFYPVATSSGTGGEEIYDVTFSGSSGNPGTGFYGLNPSDTWGLLLWDNSSPSGFENGLVGWTLDITAVPEPVNVALGVFGAVVAIGTALKYFCQGKFRLTEPLNTLETAGETPVEKCDKE